MTVIRISDLAGRSGFAPATLRYYETLGLLRPQRDRNGYRRYQPQDVDRMRFVARAKQLGLRLEEKGPALPNVSQAARQASGGGEVEAGVHVEAEPPVDLLIWTLPRDRLRRNASPVALRLLR